MNNMIIRSAFPEDIPAIARWVQMAEGGLLDFITGKTDPAAQREVVASYVSHEKSNRYSLDNCTVAEIDGKVLGMILGFAADDQPELDKPILDLIRKRGAEIGRLTTEGAPGTFYLSTMAVDPEARGKGVGSALLNEGMEIGREKGFDKFSLIVEQNNPKAQALYERLGFVVADEVEIAGHRYNRMVKSLTKSSYANN